MADRMLTFREAVLEALFFEMRASTSVIVIGEDVGVAGGVFKQTEGLARDSGIDGPWERQRVR